uniref:DH domain-containing protein n=1 Tax=Strigamia maritima TaxID=126957 RepID=T1IVC1_STRMM
MFAAFWLSVISNKRKRKRRESDSDCLSVCSLEVPFREPARRKKRLSRVASFANLLSPVRPVMKVGEALQRSWSGVKISSSPISVDSGLSVSPSSSPPSSFKDDPLVQMCRNGRKAPTKQRQSKYWRETIGKDVCSDLEDSEIRRQEAIFELFTGEEDMVEDLHLIKSTYHDSLLHLNILTNDEVQQIFGSLHTLEPLHHDLVTKLSQLRNEDGLTESIGRILVEWIPCLKAYIDYCANQVYAKALLDEKKINDKRVEDFLKRCLESPFSRKLDLWNFLDVPRNRLVKYPLLFRNICKLTPQNHVDLEYFKKAIPMIEQIISTVDIRMGESEGQFFINKLDYLDEQQKDPALAKVNCLLCKGILRNNRGTKLTAFLFDQVLVLTRPVTRNDRGRLYQVYRQPMPSEEIIIEDIKDGEVKMGSFRSAFSHNQSIKNVFRVSFRNPLDGQGHTLMTTDEHDKKQWLYHLKKITSQSPDGISSHSVLRSDSNGSDVVKKNVR